METNLVSGPEVYSDRATGVFTINGRSYYVSNLKDYEHLRDFCVRMIIHLDNAPDYENGEGFKDVESLSDPITQTEPAPKIDILAMPQNDLPVIDRIRTILSESGIRLPKETDMGKIHQYLVRLHAEGLIVATERPSRKNSTLHFVEKVLQQNGFTKSNPVTFQVLTVLLTLNGWRTFARPDRIVQSVIESVTGGKLSAKVFGWQGNEVWLKEE